LTFDDFQSLGRYFLWSDRNGVFHFQADYWDDRSMDWFDVPTADWSTGLHHALHEFMLELGTALRSTSPDRNERLKKFMRAGQK